MQAARSRGASAATAAAFVASGTSSRPPAEARECSDAHHQLEYDPARIISMPTVSANHLEAAAAQVTGRGGKGYSRGGGHGRESSDRKSYRGTSKSGASEQAAAPEKKAPDAQPDDEESVALERVAPIAIDQKGTETTAAATAVLAAPSTEPEKAAVPPETMPQHLAPQELSASSNTNSALSSNNNNSRSNIAQRRSSHSSLSSHSRGALSASGGSVSHDRCAAFMADVALRVARDPRVQASVLDNLHWPQAANAAPGAASGAAAAGKVEGADSTAPPRRALSSSSLGSYDQFHHQDEGTWGSTWASGGSAGTTGAATGAAAAGGGGASLSDDWAMLDSPALSNSSPSSSFSVEPPAEKAASFDTVASTSSSSSSIASNHLNCNGDFSGVGAAMLMESQEWEASCASALISTETGLPRPLPAEASSSSWSPWSLSELEALEKQQQHFNGSKCYETSDIHRFSSGGNSNGSSNGSSGSSSSQVCTEPTTTLHQLGSGDASSSSPPLAAEVASLRAEVAAAQRHLAAASERNADLALANQALHRELCDVYRRLGELSGLSHAKNDNKGTHGGWTTTSDSKSSRSRDGSSKSSTGATEGATSRDQVARAAKLLMEAQQAFVWPRPATMATASAAAASAAAARKGSVGEGHGADDGDATATLSDAMAAAYGFSTSAAGPAPAAASVAPAREAQVAWAVQGVLDEWQQRQLTEHSTGVHNRSSREKQYGDTAGIKDQHDHDDDDEDSDDVAFGDEDLDALIRGAAYTAAISIVVVAALQARKSPLAVQMAEAARAAFSSSVANVAAAAAKMAQWPLLE